MLSFDLCHYRLRHESQPQGRLRPFVLSSHEVHTDQEGCPRQKFGIQGKLSSALCTSIFRFTKLSSESSRYSANVGHFTEAITSCRFRMSSHIGNV